MSIEARKIEFVKEFLRLQDELTISRLEKILGIAKVDSVGSIPPMLSKEDVNARIEQSESDFSEGKFKRSSEVLSRYE